MLNNEQKVVAKEMYLEASSAQIRKDVIALLARDWRISVMEIRQYLQEAKVYKANEGPTVKEQYAKALWAITNIPEKEWMKMNKESQVKLMDLFKNINKRGS